MADLIVFPLRIRRAEMDDVPAIAHLIERSIRILCAGVYTPEQVESLVRSSINVDRQIIADGTYFVAEVNNRIIGVGGWSMRPAMHGTGHEGEQSRLLDPARDAARLRLVYVAPEWARRGIASKLVETAEVGARLAQFRRLELLATLNGVPLYRKNGYQQLEQIDVPMADGRLVPGVHMEKQIA